MFGGLQIAGNTTAIIVPNAAAKLTQGWALMSANANTKTGDLTVVPSVANSRLVLTPGLYNVSCTLTIETETDAGTSGDASGIVTAQIYRAGSAVAGTKGKHYIGTADQPTQIKCGGLVEITEAQQAAGTNYVEVYLSSGDASGNDATVSEGQFVAQKVG